MTAIRSEVVVGYDGSTGSKQALIWAAGEADQSEATLTICHAWFSPDFPWPAESADAEPARRYGEQVLADGVYRAEAAASRAKVRGLLANEPPAQALCKQADAADMVVLGCRGRGGLPGLLLGSVSSQVAAHATGPVTIVRGRWQPRPGRRAGPVAVGTDGSEACQPAVAFAFEEAARRDVPVLAVCALADAAGVLGCAKRIEAESDAVLARCQHAHPEVPMHRLVDQGSARRALLHASAGAQLLVVGARGWGGIDGMMLGSVATAAVHHAACPVSLIRSPDSDRRR